MRTEIGYARFSGVHIGRKGAPISRGYRDQFIAVIAPRTSAKIALNIVVIFSISRPVIFIKELFSRSPEERVVRLPLS